MLPRRASHWVFMALQAMNTWFVRRQILTQIGMSVRSPDDHCDHWANEAIHLRLGAVNLHLGVTDEDDALSSPELEPIRARLQSADATVTLIAGEAHLDPAPTPRGGGNPRFTPSTRNEERRDACPLTKSSQKSLSHCS